MLCGVARHQAVLVGSHRFRMETDTFAKGSELREPR